MTCTKCMKNEKYPIRISNSFVFCVLCSSQCRNWQAANVSGIFVNMSCVCVCSVSYYLLSYFTILLIVPAHTAFNSSFSLFSISSCFSNNNNNMKFHSWIGNSLDLVTKSLNETTKLFPFPVAPDNAFWWRRCCVCVCDPIQCCLWFRLVFHVLRL